MTRRRFIADLVVGDRAALLGDHAAHLSRVLRVRAGQEFDIAAEGIVRRGLVVGVNDERVDFELAERVSAPAVLPATLYLGIFKFDRLEWAIEKCTELGVARIVPLIAARTDVHLAAASNKRVERWRRLAAQAAEQSRRVAPPQIDSPLRLNPEVLSAASGTRVVLAETERHVALGQLMQDLTSGAGQPSSWVVSLAAGPEGGWTEAELRLFSSTSWSSASLGPNILRAETAAISALAIVLSWYSFS